MKVRLRRSLLLATLALFLLSSRGMSQVPEPVMPDETVYPAPAARTKLLTYGTGLLLAFYGVSLGSSFLWADDPGASDLAIPFAGPWMKLGQTTLCGDLEVQADARCSDVSQVVGAVGVTILGIGQAASAIFLLEGAFMKVGPKGAAQRGLRYGFRMPSAGAAQVGREQGLASGIQAGQIRLWPVPVATTRMTGLGLVGEF